METNKTTTQISTTNTGMKMNDPKGINYGKSASNDPEFDELSQDETDFELASTLIELGSIKTKIQNTVKVSEDTVVASESMDVESVMVDKTTVVAETLNLDPSTSANVAQNVNPTNTGCIDGNEQNMEKF